MTLPPMKRDNFLIRTRPRIPPHLIIELLTRLKSMGTPLARAGSVGLAVYRLKRVEPWVRISVVEGLWQAMDGAVPLSLCVPRPSRDSFGSCIRIFHGIRNVLSVFHGTGNTLEQRRHCHPGTVNRPSLATDSCPSLSSFRSLCRLWGQGQRPI